MTYEVILRNHATQQSVEADNFVTDKGGIVFNRKNGDDSVNVAFFPQADVESVKENK